MADLMNDLLTASRTYGSDPRWVVAGGGNTSLKDGDVLYVKASGYALATIDEGGFARMDRRRLAAIWETEYPSGEDAVSVAERERLVLADMMAARAAGEERRPSVETLLHDMLPWPLVVHLHPTLVNGLTCGADGEGIAEELFGDAMCWIPVTDPGYVLATVIRNALEDRTARGLGDPDYIFLANHGVFAGGDDYSEVKAKYDRLEAALEARVSARPGVMPAAAALPEGVSEALQAAAAGFFGPDAATSFVAGGELEGYLSDAGAAVNLIGCLTPDHIVYAGPGCLYLGPDALTAAGGDIAAAWKTGAEAYRAEWGKPPNITLMNDGEEFAGAVAAAAGRKALENAVLMLENALEVCVYAASFGGPKLLEHRFIRFIVDWEVENYRSKVASS